MQYKSRRAGTSSEQACCIGTELKQSSHHAVAPTSIVSLLHLVLFCFFLLLGQLILTLLFLLKLEHASAGL